MLLSDLVERCNKRYAECNSYRDKGVASMRTSVAGTKPAEIEFNTYFRRPDKFRFEWHSWHPYFGKDKPPTVNVIVSDGQQIASNLGCIKRESVHASLENAVWSAIGISLGTAGRVLPLLRPDLETKLPSVFALKNLRLVHDYFSEQDALLVLGSAAHQEDTEILISKVDNLLLEVKQHLEVTPQDTNRFEMRSRHVPTDMPGTFSLCRYSEIDFDMEISDEMFVLSKPISLP